jgi:hypothetical protein
VTDPYGRIIGFLDLHIYTYHSPNKQITAHKATQTIKNTLHTMNKMEEIKISNAILITGRGGL